MTGTMREQERSSKTAAARFRIMVGCWVVDWVVPHRDTPSFSKLLDLLMLVWTPGGEDRTADEFGALLGAAGFELTGSTPTRAGVSVLEAAPR